MAIVDSLNRVRDWLQAEVCDHIELKQPQDESCAEEYCYKLVHPTAFVVFTPTKDRLPPNIESPFPSVCVRLSEGEHKDGKNRMQLILNVCVWNPGIHGKDVFTPVDGAGRLGYIQGEDGTYTRSADGWQDAMSFVDAILRAIETTENIDGLRVVSEDGIKYGTTGDQLDDLYPYWAAWIAFTVESGNTRAKSIEEFL